MNKKITISYDDMDGVINSVSKDSILGNIKNLEEEGFEVELTMDDQVILVGLDKILNRFNT